MKAKKVRIGIIGMGKLGQALARGLLRNSNRFEIRGTTKTRAPRERLKIPCDHDNLTLVKNSDIVILAVKPHQAESVLRPLSKAFHKRQILISVCAAITIDQLREWTQGKVSVARVMPNLPSVIGEGMTAIASDGLSPTQKDQCVEIFSQIGRTATLEESLFDGVTALSACGPAFIFLIIEALSEAGVKLGIPRDSATLLSAQTMLGSAKLVLDGNRHPAALKDEVTTPGGCTIDGLMALEDGKMRATLIKAVVAAADRSSRLRKQ